MTQDGTKAIENFVRGKLGEEYKSINFVPNFNDFDLDIIILTKTHGFIKFPVHFQDLMDRTASDAHDYIFDGLKSAIEKEMEKDVRVGET